MNGPEKQEILEFLKKNPMGTISTIHADTGAPESALIAFAETNELEIIFQTFYDARKYTNLKNDSRIAFVTGWEIEKINQITFQYEGFAQELKVGTNKYNEYRKIFEGKKTPCTIEFLDNPKSRIFLVTSTWFSYSDYTQEIPRIIEERF